MLHAVIMAGGSGTRFWPASRKAVPKQLLRLVGQRTMLQSTVDRLSGLVSNERVLVMSNEVLVAAMNEQLPEVPPENVVGEPYKRDTAPCIGLAAALVLQADPDGIMLVLPADHVIPTREAFHQAIRYGQALIEKDPKRIVTFGIRPTYPAESFGYIQRGDALESVTGFTDSKGFDVGQFREKPDRQTAEQYLAAGTYYWNSGIFMWRARTILDALQQYEPEMAANLNTIAASIGTPDFKTVFHQQFEMIKGKSIDYAVMEQYKEVVVVEADFEWDDVGSWQSLVRLGEPDENKNTSQGRFLPIDSTGMVVRSDDNHLVVTIGMQDTIVVHTPDATLVAPKSEEERVREVVRRLQEEGLDQYL